MAITSDGVDLDALERLFHSEPATPGDDDVAVYDSASRQWFLCMRFPDSDKGCRCGAHSPIDPHQRYEAWVYDHDATWTAQLTKAWYAGEQHPFAAAMLLAPGLRVTIYVPVDGRG